MNDENKNPPLEALIEPELEARLVAAVLGEASAFETAELERLVLEKPELGIFKRRIEAVHGLVGAASRIDQASLRLSPERRAKILETIGAAPARAPGSNANAPVLLPLAKAKRKRRKQWIWASGLAASVMFSAILAQRFMIEPPARPSPMPTLLGPVPVELPAVSESAIVDGAALRSTEAIQFSQQAVELSPFTVDTAPSIADRVRRAFTPSAPPAEAEARPARSGGGRGGAGGSARRMELTAGEMRAKELQTVDQLAKKREANAVAGVPQNLNFGIGEKAKEDFYVKSLSKAEFDKDERKDLALSPFEINTSTDRGYAAGNTLSGSRLNTKLGALDGNISVVTKQSLEDRSSIEFSRTAPKSAVASDGFLEATNTAPWARSYGGFANKIAAQETPLETDQRLSRQNAAALPAPVLKSPSSVEVGQGEASTAKEPVSTFSLHVSDVSFRLAQTALARGETPDPTRIRPEEFYNAFDYGDPSPTPADKVSARIEQAAHPLLQQRNLVRIAMKVASSGRGAGQPLHLTLLLDTSGSMEREDRIASVQRALGTLASLLGAKDRVTLIGFAREPRLLADQLPGDQAAKLAGLASKTPFTGGTNLEEALKLAGDLARRHRDPAAQNRIVLLTDGAANLGNADPVQLTAMVESLRQQNIALDACGVGTDGLDDTILEALTRKGDGRYYVLNQPEDAGAGFAQQLAGAFRPAAENVKVQVRFNPARVSHYRLIGFEQHRLRQEDFRNDQVDAAELAADEAAVALYQVEVLPQGDGELGDVFVRFRDAATGSMVERSWTMLHEPRARAFDRATPTIQLAGVASLLAEKLRGGPAADLINLEELAPVVNSLRGHYAGNARVQELITMFEQLRRRNGK